MRLGIHRQSLRFIACEIKLTLFSRIDLTATGFYDWSIADYDPAANTGPFTDYFSFGAGLVQVSVDCGTGAVAVDAAALVMDVGRSLNPALDVGQVCRRVT